MEIIGIIGTLFIVFAFAQTGERKIRILDGIGALLFIVYGIQTHTFSTVLLNFILICVHIYKLAKATKGT